MSLQLRLFAYRALRAVATLDITVVMWLERRKLRLPVSEHGDFTFQFLAADELRVLARDETIEIQPSMAERIERGSDFCFAALCRDRLASYAWFALDSIEAEYNRGQQLKSGVAVSFPTYAAFMYKGFTHPDYRGRKLHGAVVGRALLDLAPLGVETVLSTSDWSNRTARRALAGIGFEELGLCYRWGLGDWLHTFPPREAERRGVQFGAEAVVEPRPRMPPPRPASRLASVPWQPIVHAADEELQHAEPVLNS